MAPSPTAHKIGSGLMMGRFRRQAGGSAAVEFALVAPIFFGLLFAILETALVFFASQVLETVTGDSARLILTGQAQEKKLTKEQFKAALCERVVALFDCSNGIFIDVRSFPSFQAINLTPPIDAENRKFVDDTQYDPGHAGDIVVVRVFYQWPLIVTGLGWNMSNLAGNQRLLSATAAFRNEPFE